MKSEWRWISLARLRYWSRPSRLTWVQKLRAWEWYNRMFCGLVSVRFDLGDEARAGRVGIEQLSKTAYLLLSGVVDCEILDTSEM